MILYGTNFLYLTQSAPYLTDNRSGTGFGAKNDDLLVSTRLIIAVLTMHEENGKVEDVKVGYWGIEACWE